MKVLSVNAGTIREVEWNGAIVTTAIFKTPVTGRVAVRDHHVEGDHQANPAVHGGPLKAVYAYPSEHYPLWKAELPGRDLPLGVFGENLTTEGLSESGLCVGDRVKIGTTVLEVTQPRSPCFKLGIRFGWDGIIKRFLDSGRSGFYFSIVEEGELGAGDEITIVHRDPRRVSIQNVVESKRKHKNP